MPDERPSTGQRQVLAYIGHIRCHTAAWATATTENAPCQCAHLLHLLKLLACLVLRLAIQLSPVLVVCGLSALRVKPAANRNSKNTHKVRVEMVHTGGFAVTGAGHTIGCCSWHIHVHPASPMPDKCHRSCHAVPYQITLQHSMSAAHHPLAVLVSQGHGDGRQGSDAGKLLLLLLLALDRALHLQRWDTQHNTFACDAVTPHVCSGTHYVASADAAHLSLPLRHLTYTALAHAELQGPCRTNTTPEVHPALRCNKTTHMPTHIAAHGLAHLLAGRLRCGRRALRNLSAQRGRVVQLPHRLACGVWWC